MEVRSVDSLKKVILVAFLLLASYFFGLGIMARPDVKELVGFFVVGVLHVAAGIGTWKENDNLTSAAKYLLFLDLVFSIIMIMGGVFVQGGTMMFLSGLTLMAISTE